MGLGRKWTAAEEEYLKENWGQVSFENLSKKLNRSVAAIQVRVNRIGLAPFLESGDYVTLCQLIIAVTGSYTGYSYKMRSWVKNRDLPVHKKRRGKSSIRIVYLDEFWKWAEKNRSFLDFSKMEPHALGQEPAWVAEQRHKDYRAFAVQRKDPWTPAEDDRLKRLLKHQKYGYAELSNILHRSAGAIQRRCTDLGLKERPLKADNHGAGSVWTQEHFDILANGIRNGDSYTQIGQVLGKSEKAVRGKVYFVYLTENADKVRLMMDDGPWGTGAPEPTVKQGIYLSRTRTEVRNNLATLAALLAYRRNELGYDPYWQRFMCQHWHDIKGCTAGGKDCDSCTSFLRIRPQYCARCGVTFYERAENRFCLQCRTARKKQAQKKWQILNSR